MNRSTLRQKHLYLASRLYELAADFNDNELKSIRAVAERYEDSVAIKSAIDALLQLHKEVTPATSANVETIHKQQSEKSGGGTERRSLANRRVLAEILANPNIFPTIQDIGAVLPSDMQPVPKESRERYMRRILKRLDSLEQSQKVSIERSLEEVLKRRPNNFLSEWKSLILGM